MLDRYDPWVDLRSRPDLTFAIMRLPIADALYFSDVPGIVMDDRLTKIERRCVLAHELAHIDLGHHHQVAGRGQGTGRLARRNELEADQLAARRMVDLERVAEVAAWASCRWEVADELNVTERLLVVRLQHLHPSERGLLIRKGVRL